MFSRLHGDISVVNEDLLGQEVSANGGLVLVGELLVHILVHQRGLADTTNSSKKLQKRKKEI